MNLFLYCYYFFSNRVHKNTKPIVLTEYGSKSGKFNNSGSKLSLSSGDRRLAQSAQMYHYQHQKQQMIAMEKYEIFHFRAMIEIIFILLIF
jgi:hypothetical protein